MITIRKYKYPEIRLYGPDGKFIGLIENRVELNDVRIQIAQQKAEGYYITFEDAIISILPNGDCNKWPPRFFDEDLKQFATLVAIRRGESYKYNIYN